MFYLTISYLTNSNNIINTENIYVYFQSAVSDAKTFMWVDDDVGGLFKKKSSYISNTAFLVKY